MRWNTPRAVMAVFLALLVSVTIHAGVVEAVSQPETVILADAADPYYSLATEIAGQENLPIVHSLDEALYREPAFLLWVVSPGRLSDQVLVDFGLAMRERSSSIYNARLQATNMGQDKLVLFEHAGGDFSLHLRSRVLWARSASDLVLDALDGNLAVSAGQRPGHYHGWSRGLGLGAGGYTVAAKESLRAVAGAGGVSGCRPGDSARPVRSGSAGETGDHLQVSRVRFPVAGVHLSAGCVRRVLFSSRCLVAGPGGGGRPDVAGLVGTCGFSALLAWRRRQPCREGEAGGRSVEFPPWVCRPWWLLASRPFCSGSCSRRFVESSNTGRSSRHNLADTTINENRLCVISCILHLASF
jgi:hypothetical protein